MPLAVEHIRRMRGGAQAQLLRCRDKTAQDLYYIVKFPNNPQGLRILANELLAARLGLPVPYVAAVEVREDLVRNSADLKIQLGRSSIACQAGFCFGSQYPGDPSSMVVYDLLPDEQLRSVENLAAFAGMLAFDKWTCNTNGRQAVFFRAPGRLQYRAMMVDQGFCFNAGEWNFPDAPLRGIYLRQCVYEAVCGMDSFEPYLARIERLDEAALEQAAEEIPPEWYGFDSAALYRLLEQLHRRRTLVRDLLMATWKSERNPFPNWT